MLHVSCQSLFLVQYSSLQLLVHLWGLGWFLALNFCQNIISEFPYRFDLSYRVICLTVPSLGYLLLWTGDFETSWVLVTLVHVELVSTYLIWFEPFFWNNWEWRIQSSVTRACSISFWVTSGRKISKLKTYLKLNILSEANKIPNWSWPCLWYDVDDFSGMTLVFVCYLHLSLI